VPLAAMAIEIGMRAMRGAKEFAIRLDPEDLGRVDVRLEVSEEGQVQARVVVEKVETLQLLQRDARTLERAFDQAGLNTSPDGLQFSLRDPGSQGRNGEGGDSRHASAQQAANEDEPAFDDIKLRPGLYRSAAGGLDIRI
jgi:flagellar hook-length control protein FliK